jgi:hypothetical protein
MHRDGEAFKRYAKAERELCEMAGAVLANIINEIEIRHGIKIAELRVTPPIVLALGITLQAVLTAKGSSLSNFASGR